jgi:predicted transcriptional regulator
MGTTQDDEQSNSGAVGDSPRQKYFGSDYIRTQKQIAAVGSYRDLIEVLQSEQPLSATEIAEALGTSKGSVLLWLKRLINLDLIKKIRFEQHVLYCTNGLHQTLIYTSLQE